MILVAVVGDEMVIGRSWVMWDSISSMCKCRARREGERDMGEEGERYDQLIGGKRWGKGRSECINSEMRGRVCS